MRLTKHKDLVTVDKFLTFLIIEHYWLCWELSIEDWLEVYKESDLEEFCKIVKEYKKIINDVNVNRVGE